MLKILLYFLFFALFYYNFGGENPLAPDFSNGRVLSLLFATSFMRITLSLVMIGGLPSLKNPKQLYLVPAVSLVLLALNLIISTRLPSQAPTYQLPFLGLTLLICLVIGYDEELFFRVFSFHLFHQNFFVYIILISLLFGLAHLNQGWASFIFASLSGLILALLYQKFQNLHLNALSHALYNFIILQASLPN